MITWMHKHTATKQNASRTGLIVTEAYEQIPHNLRALYNFNT